MFKNTIKLVSLLLLLVLSFVYTDSVFNSAKESNPVMKSIDEYKKANDILSVEPIIKDDEMIIGYTGLVVNKDESYKKMKEEDKFDEDKIVFDKSLPKTTISKTYQYYIKQGNPSKKEVALIFKVNNSNNVDELLKQIAKSNASITFFVDGAWLLENVEYAFSMNDLYSEIYNLGYDGIYQKKMITTTNNLIESITLKDSNFCLLDEKDDKQKEICKNKKMHTITPTLNNPTIKELKNGLVKGAIISYDVNYFDTKIFNLIVKTITNKGYKIKGLSNIVNEEI